MTKKSWLALQYLPTVAFIISGIGCGRPITKNGPLQSYDGRSGYRFENIQPGPGNTDETFVVVLFSGGGTRAAAVAYGVLQGLRDTVITTKEPGASTDQPVAGAPGSDVSPVRAEGRLGEQTRRLLDEVDVISSVSGGSFTAMYYGLNRDGIFDGRFEKHFLRQNIQGRLLNLVLKPLNFLRIMYSVFDRTDLAADYYDHDVFEHKTYADLQTQGYRPFVVINAADMSLGERFEFTQNDFDLLGSELTTLPVARAVAASSAFPLLLSPLRLQYHGGEPINQAIAATLRDERSVSEDRRRIRWARNLCPEATVEGATEHCLDELNHRYLYLLDGGIVDNLGVRWVIDEFRSGVLRDMRERGEIKRLVVIVVDAGTEVPNDIEKRNSAPGLLLMGQRAGSIGVYNQTLAMTGVLRHFLREHPKRQRELHDDYDREHARLCPQAPPLPTLHDQTVETYLVEVNFRSIDDAKLRKRCLSMPTTLFLSKDDVETLIEVGKSCLSANAEYQKLLSDLATGP